MSLSIRNAVITHRSVSGEQTVLCERPDNKHHRHYLILASLQLNIVQCVNDHHLGFLCNLTAAFIPQAGAPTCMIASRQPPSSEKIQGAIFYPEPVMAVAGAW